MIPLPSIGKVYLYRGSVDMRKSFNGLAALAYTSFSIDPTRGGLFVFFNKRRNLVKLLFWDESGYCITAKRLEQGTFSSFPPEGKPVSLADLHLILEGIELKNIHRKKRYQLPNI